MKNLLEEVRELSGMNEGRVDKGSGWKLFGKIGDSLMVTMDMFDEMNKDYAVTRVTRNDFSEIDPRNAKKILKLGQDAFKYIMKTQRALAELNRAFEILD